MPGQKESREGDSPPRSVATEAAKSRVRIGRACDRCKIKKSKCDGHNPCSSCTANDSICEYSARRRREARDWYWGMQDVIDEAFQMLYWACRDNSGFPGSVPDESSGRVSTDAILRGLGLNPPPVDNVRPSGSRSNSTLDGQAQSHVPRSYYPPDVLRRPPGSSQNLTASSEMTPISSNSDDRLAYGEGMPETGQRSQRASAMELDEEDDGMPDALPDGLADSLPDGLGEVLRDGVAGNIDPSMMADGHASYGGGHLYSDMGAVQFGSEMPLGAHAQQMLTQPVSQFRVPSLNQQRLEAVTQSLGAMEQEVWQGRHDESNGMLPWPGNMSSISRKGKPHGRGGFNHSADRQR